MPVAAVQNELQRRQDENELTSLRERERQLQEELEMRRTLDALNQRQMYVLVKNEEELRRINHAQLEELSRLSDKLREAESAPPPAEMVIHFPTRFINKFL